MRSVFEALRLVETLNDEAASENFGATKGASGVTCLDKAVFSSADDYDVLLYVETAAAHTRGRKQTATLVRRTFYSYTALLLRKLSDIHKSTCTNRPLSFHAFLLTEIPQRKLFFTAGEENVPDYRGVFFYDSKYENRTFLLSSRPALSSLNVQVKSTLV